MSLTIQQAARVALPRAYYRLWYKNFKNLKRFNTYKSNNSSFHVICDSFNWLQTKEGSNFWSEVDKYVINFYQDYTALPLPPIPTTTKENAPTPSQQKS